MRTCLIAGFVGAATIGLLNSMDAAAGISPEPTIQKAVAIQPVAEYFLPFTTETHGNRPGLTPKERMTHLGTDFGMMGPSRDRIDWRDGQAVVDVRDGGWAGMWHSLAGLASDLKTTLDFTRVYPQWIAAKMQPRASGVIVRLSGQGQFRLEIKSADQRVLWAWQQGINSESPREFTLNCDPDQLRAAKFLNWLAEPGADIAVDSVSLRIEFPPMSFPERVFLTSYAKLARCYDVAAGVVKNRAHWPTGSFDAVPASGLFALATATASTLGIVDQAFAEKVLLDIHSTMTALPHADGWLPHYISRDPDGRYTIHPGTEFSTIDSSFYFHGMLLAAQILRDQPMMDQLTSEIRSLRFDRLIGTDGYINHGFRTDGQAPLRGEWNNGGGESTLALLMELMATGGRQPTAASFAAWDHNGVGFIGEVQSLFYPQFDSSQPDAITGFNWRQLRLQLLASQEAYFPTHEAGSTAAKLGIFGLSAGEGPRGKNYVANGTEKVKENVIHPHYILMAGRWEPAKTYDLLREMESKGLLPPWGLVENIDPTLGEYLPMLGSLNAAFECLGSYHMWMRWAETLDVIDAASAANPLMASAIRVLYPAAA
jgi:hypothetical protein